MEKLTPFEQVELLYPKHLTSKEQQPSYVRLMVESYAEIMKIDKVDAAYWVKNTFCEQLGWELSEEQWGGIIGDETRMGEYPH